MRDLPAPTGRGITGLALLPGGQLAVGLGDQTIVFALEPGEMRALATELLNAAVDVEAHAAAVTDAAIAKAGGRQ